MRYIQVNNNIWVEIDELTMRSTLFDMNLVPEEIEIVQNRLNEIPNSPPDEELLNWARLNYPMVDYSEERQSLLGRLENLQDKLNQI